MSLQLCETARGWVLKISVCILFILVATNAFGGTAAAEYEYARPEFSDPYRLQKLKAVLPDVDKLFHDFFEAEHLPGLVYGVILDGDLIHSGALGYANVERNIPVSRHTAFRIASMTKSFLALAIFKLRDDAKLALDDPVEKYIPELRKVRLPTSDSPRITIRNLMTMTTGLPEDNPWGDRQMAISKGALRKFVRGGLSFSNPPGQQFEYSNLGFVLLGQVVTKASGMPFQRYITGKVLRPLGMDDTRWEFSEVPAENLALGYRWEHEHWKQEPILHDGEGAACGGLLSTLEDFAKYTRFHLQAWPARDGAERGPVRRATVREMHRPFVYSSLSLKSASANETNATGRVAFYGYGLGWSIDHRQAITLGHSGGLPGYGSHYRFLPDYGVAVIAFANLTYAPASPPCIAAIELLLERAHLQPRTTRPSHILETRAEQVRELVTTWDPRLKEEILAENFFLDKSPEDWAKESQVILAKAGKIESVGPLKPENQLRGTFTLQAEKGNVKVFFTLTPEKEPKIQQLKLVLEAK